MNLPQSSITRLMNFFNNISYQIYIFQLENYDIFRYVRFLKKRFLKSTEKRQSIVWTAKLTVLVILAGVLMLVVSIGLSLGTTKMLEKQMIILIVSILVSLFLFPVFLILSQILLYPLDYYLKTRIIHTARKKMASFKNLTVIGIAGSYGKTTAKEFIAAVVSKKYKVLKTPENINTPLGISQLILNDLNDDCDIFVVEMGEYVKGDIANICSIVKPSIGILTGINDAHFERMGSMQNAIESIFELAENTSGSIFLNADDVRIIDNFQAYTIGRSVNFFSAKNSQLAQYQIKNVTFLESPLSYVFILEKDGVEVGNVKTRFLGEYILGTIMLSFMVGELFDISLQDITMVIENIKPIKHRLEPIINNNGTIIIDDSYNGNSTGAAEAIQLLSKFSSRKKIYITPGIVESGNRAKEIHYEIGKKLGTVADLVLLINNSVTDYLIDGLESVNYPKEQIIIFVSAKEAHQQLSTLIAKNDVILFQNDWPDNYL